MKRLIGILAMGAVAAAAVAGGWLSGGEDVPVTAPVPISVESPFRYPIALWDRRAEGETTLMVHVTDVGGVDSAYVLRSSGENAFDSAALAGARELRFAPARRGGDRVSRWVRLPVRFRMPPDSSARREG